MWCRLESILSSLTVFYETKLLLIETYQGGRHVVSYFRFQATRETSSFLRVNFGRSEVTDVSLIHHGNVTYVSRTWSSRVLPILTVRITCDQAFFFQRRAKEKQRETRRSVGSRAILSRSSEKRTPDRHVFYQRPVAASHEVGTQPE